MSKECRFCHKALPEEAVFCPYCAKSQIEKETVEVPVPKRKRIVIGCIIILAVLFVVLLTVYQLKPKTYDSGTAEVVYQNGSSTWHVLLRNTVEDVFHWQTPQNEFSRMCTAGTMGAVPLQLYVYEEETGHSVSEEFLALLESSEVTANPRDGAKAMQCSIPAYHPGFELAMQVSDIVFDTDCGTNDIVWTLRLKNRDTIVLHEAVEILTNPEITYSYENTPLSTTEELQTLIDQVKEEVEDPNTVVNILLAPIEYEGDVMLTDRAVNLYGSEDEKGSTVFRGCLTIDNRNPLYATFENIAFEGSGIGIYATEGFVANNCTFKGKETGIMGAEGSWPILDSCSFENCGTGLDFNSSASSMRNAYYHALTFEKNDIGVLLEKVPSEDILYFIECTFEGNGTDIENRAGNEVSFTLDNAG